MKQSRFSLRRNRHRVASKKWKENGEKEQKDYSDYLFEQEVKIGALTFTGGHQACLEHFISNR